MTLVISDCILLGHSAHGHNYLALASAQSRFYFPLHSSLECLSHYLRRSRFLNPRHAVRHHRQVTPLPPCPGPSMIPSQLTLYSLSRATHRLRNLPLLPNLLLPPRHHHQGVSHPARTNSLLQYRQRCLHKVPTSLNVAPRAKNTDLPPAPPRPFRLDIHRRDLRSQHSSGSRQNPLRQHPHCPRSRTRAREVRRNTLRDGCGRGIGGEAVG
jgi:hypothetical protein